MKYILLLIIIIFSFSTCFDKKTNVNRSYTSSANKIDKTGITPNEPYTGISTNSNILVKEGFIEIQLNSGSLDIGFERKLQMLKDNQLNANLSLSDAVTNTKMEGSVEITKEANIRFIPETKLSFNNVYTISFQEEQTSLEYSEKIFISVANYCNPSDSFSKVPIQSNSQYNGQTVNLTIKDNIFQDQGYGKVAIVGWDHKSLQSFHFKIKNQTDGAKYKIVAVFGSYNIPSHECELYLQRDKTSPYPTWVDSNYSSKTTTVTEEDAIIRDPFTKDFYSFAKTFILVKVSDSTNTDITSTDNAVLSLEQTDTLYGLPVSLTNEDESPLLAYLNRGNNNSYSMVLGGLIVGIFGFFLSRRWMRRKEEEK
ncbi:MAG: hypothetical protein IPQ05_15075 [Leptospiraceae bacterium]|nr:hypothetical protein [Leptospiraceae bacterium]MBL0265143.1 hypothetical protein [Leptospiraceae bacterium]